MRTIRENEYTKVIALDEPDQSVACHEYEVQYDQKYYGDMAMHVDFQKGPIKENGVNGIQTEDLIAICIDRLEGFQNGPYPCHENEQALVRLQNALSWLDSRTKNRKQRGVEGKNIK